MEIVTFHNMNMYVSLTKPLHGTVMSLDAELPIWRIIAAEFLAESGTLPVNSVCIYSFCMDQVTEGQSAGPFQGLCYCMTLS